MKISLSNLLSIQESAQSTRPTPPERIRFSTLFTLVLAALAIWSAPLRADSISSVSGPTTVSPNSTVTVAVTYSVTDSRTLRVNFQNPGNGWAWYGAGQINVNAGSGTVNVPVSTGAAPTGSGFCYNAQMLSGNTLTAGKTQENITVSTSGSGSTGTTRIRTNLGTNFWFVYSDQTAPAWTGAYVWRASNLNFASESNPWSETFLDEIKPYQVLRFMDWFGGNGDPQTDWNLHRTRKSDSNQFGGAMGNDIDGDGYSNDIAPMTQGDGRNTWGVAVEWLMDLCNRNNSDMWINIPYKAINADDFPSGNDFNNEYVHKLAVLLRTGVDMRAVNLKNWVGGKNNLGQLSAKSKQDFINAGGVDTGKVLDNNLKIYVEYSNELWCCNRPQVKWVATQGPKVGLNDSQWDRRFGAYAEVRVWKAFQDVFGSAAMGSRIIRVAGPNHRENGTAAAFAPYFNDVYNNTASNRNPWRSSGVYMDAWKWASYIGGNGSDWKAQVDADANANKSFAQAMKSAYGISRFISYEGGQHLDINPGGFARDGATYNRYQYWLDKEDDAYDLIVHYSHYGTWQNNGVNGSGSWGAKSFVGQSASEAPKYRALRDYAMGGTGAS